jgi:hypothetical protein
MMGLTCVDERMRLKSVSIKIFDLEEEIPAISSISIEKSKL